MRSNPRQRRSAGWILGAFIALTGCDPGANPRAELGSRQSALMSPGVEAFAGVVGGVATTGVPGPCSTYGPPEPEASFFISSLDLSVPEGGIAYCGYAGDTSDTTAATGPVSATQTLTPPVLLGNPGYAGTYTGSAQASADFKILKAGASGTVTTPGEGSPVALDNSSGAAIFDDMLTVTSNRVSSPSPGYVRYTFEFDGTLSTPGMQVAFMPGSATAMIRFEHDNGPNYLLVAVNVSVGMTGTFTALDSSGGNIVTSTGTITASGTFTSKLTDSFGQITDQAITVGQPFRLKAGLMATMVGTGNADFTSTARLVKLQFFDQNHAPIIDATVTSASGTFYDACTETISPTSQDFPAGGGQVTVTVTAPSAECAWTAASNEGFLTVSSGASGTGTGTVTIVAAANTGASRQGTVTIAGQTFTATQDQACTYAITPSSQSVGAAGGNGTVSVTASTGCSWTATSNDAFVTISSGQSGSGAGTVAYSVTANTGAARNGTLTIAGKTFTVSQDAASGSTASGGGKSGCSVTGSADPSSPLLWVAAALALARARRRTRDSRRL